VPPKRSKCDRAFAWSLVNQLGHWSLKPH